MITFGIPKQDRKRKEEHDFPVMTMKKVPTKESDHRTYRFNFNKAAIIDLGLENLTNQKVAFGVEDGNMFIVNATELPLASDAKANVTMTGNVSSKSYHDFVSKHFGADVNSDNKYALLRTSKTEETGAFKVEPLIEEDISSEESIEAPITDTEEIIIDESNMNDAKQVTERELTF